MRGTPASAAARMNRDERPGAASTPPWPWVQTIIDALAAAVADLVMQKLNGVNMTLPGPGAADSRWLCVKEAAAYARAGTWTIYKAIRSGQLPARWVGRRLVVDRNDLDGWIQGLPPAEAR